MKMMNQTGDIIPVLEKWQAAWPQAQKVWSNYVRLREPEWCLSKAESAKKGLSQSFAMIRLKDHRIVIDIASVIETGIVGFPVEVLAHEIGHHLYAPANLKDNASLLAKVSWCLAGYEHLAPMVANLYEDMLINDRLQRSKDLDMAGVFACLPSGESSKLWTLYLRSYEYLWRLKRGALAKQMSLHSDQIDADASVLASLVRSYSKNWLEGAGRFAAVLYSYFLDEDGVSDDGLPLAFNILLDADEAGEGGGLVAGLAEIDADGGAESVDPRSEAMGNAGDTQQLPLASADKSRSGAGPQQRYLNPGVYVDLLQKVNPSAEKNDLLMQYYKEIALPFLVDFPRERESSASMTLPEGLETWEFGDSADEIDWLESAIYSPHIIPGVNTLKRTYGASDDDENAGLKALDVYIGIDCSGSMGDPAVTFSWPVLAAAIVALSALRSGAKVMACLSGEPGSYLQNDGFVQDERELLSVLTSYLGTGYAYGIGRLKEPFALQRKTKSHIIIVTDDDIFSMLSAKTDNGDDNWEIVETALRNAGGRGTMILHSRSNWHKEDAGRLRSMGWDIHYVTNESELLAFGESFSKQHYSS